MRYKAKITLEFVKESIKDFQRENAVDGFDAVVQAIIVNQSDWDSIVDGVRGSGAFGVATDDLYKSYEPISLLGYKCYTSLQVEPGTIDLIGTEIPEIPKL